jgi:hypothetical protein
MTCNLSLDSGVCKIHTGTSITILLFHAISGHTICVALLIFDIITLALCYETGCRELLSAALNHKLTNSFQCRTFKNSLIKPLLPPLLLASRNGAILL